MRECFYRELSEMNLGGNVESCWDSLMNGLLRPIDKTYGWMQGLARHETTRSWQDEVDRAVQENQNLKLGRGEEIRRNTWWLSIGQEEKLTRLKTSTGLTCRCAK